MKTKLKRGWLVGKKLLSLGNRLVLINSLLSSLSMFMLSFFEVPRGVLKKIDYYISRFFWQYDQQQKKNRLMKWSIICQPKVQGGLDLQNHDIKNNCLLSKWLYKLYNEEGFWQQLLRNKYVKDKTLSQPKKKVGDSHFR